MLAQIEIAWTLIVSDIRFRWKLISLRGLIKFAAMKTIHFLIPKRFALENSKLEVDIY